MCDEDRGIFGWLFVREPLRVVLLFALVVLLAVTVPAYLYTSRREQRLERFGVTTTGTVVSAERGCSGGTRQKAEVSYVVEGEEHLLEAHTDPNDPLAEVGLFVGQIVEVRYDPEALSFLFLLIAKG